MTDDEFLAAFEAAAITRKDWTHEAHVRMAWLYLTRLPFAEALEKVRSGIRHLNTAISRRENLRCIAPKKRKTGGYHDTITVAYVHVIAGRLTPDEDFPTFRDRHPDLFDRTLPALLCHYTKERLYSAEARKAFVEPDREALPDVEVRLTEVRTKRRTRRKAKRASARTAGSSTVRGG
jgi:hypothetical protein